ncbi:hypothetical protein ACWGPC_58875, partial [Streptomyces mirabilis]
MRGVLFGSVRGPAGPRGRGLRRGTVAVLAAGSLALSAGCSSGGGSGSMAGVDGTPPVAGSSSPAAPGPSAPKPSASPSLPPVKGSVKVVSTLTEGLESPWG